MGTDRDTRASLSESGRTDKVPERGRRQLGLFLHCWARAARREGLSGVACRVAWCLHDYARMDDSFKIFRNSGAVCAYPSVDRLAADVGATRRPVQEALRRLEDLGLLRAKLTRGGARWSTNMYELLMPEYADEALTDETTTRVETSAGRNREPASKRTVNPRRNASHTRVETSARIRKEEEKERARAERGAAPSRDAAAPPQHAESEVAADASFQIAEEEDLSTVKLRLLIDHLDADPSEALEALRDEVREYDEKNGVGFRTHPSDDPSDAYEEVRFLWDWLRTDKFLDLLEERRNEMKPRDYAALRRRAERSLE